ncbi:translation initiation factor IF-2 [Candidatus Roizmanbacteria bacterium]|nr:translation initiation factor IF-2 [Candidatus Roizmanbacteria bacterium]
MYRPPVVTILGHVDHGKTSLLDYIRKSHVADREYGGITQKIGAYEIETSYKDYHTSKITFIDTPGHEAFSELRSRGANVADLAILIIDAKDSLKPQTVESIYHIKNAKIPFIVALNKTDLPDANPNKVKTDLMKHEIITEDKGGTVPVIEISAKTGKNVEELLEHILLLASDMNLESDPSHELKAYIIETKKDKRGIIPSVIIKDGSLKVGETVYAGHIKAKIKSMINDLGKPVTEVIPCMPFEILGFEEMPELGVFLSRTPPEDKKEVTYTQNRSKFDIRAMYEAEAQEEKKRLALVIKADSQGSLDAIVNTLAKNPDIVVNLSAVGDIHRSDVFLAKTTNSIIIGFNAQIANEVKELVKQEKVIIKTYNIIYELFEELEEVSKIIKEKEEKERSLKGEAKILATFVIEGETVFGVKVTKGKLNLADTIDLYRDDKLIGKTKLVSLKQRAKSVSEIKKDQEGGTIFSPQLDIKIGDVVKSIL